MEILPKFSGSISVFEQNKSKVFRFKGGKKKVIHVIFFQQKALFSSEVLKGRTLSTLSHATVKKQLCDQVQLLICSGFIGIIVLINTELCQKVTPAANVCASSSFVCYADSFLLSSSLSTALWGPFIIQTRKTVTTP